MYGDLGLKLVSLFCTTNLALGPFCALYAAICGKTRLIIQTPLEAATFLTNARFNTPNERKTSLTFPRIKPNSSVPSLANADFSIRKQMNCRSNGRNWVGKGLRS